MTIPAAPAAPSRYAVEAWQLAYDDLDKEISKWSRRLSRGEQPLTVSERNRLRVLTEAVTNVTRMSGESAQVAAYSIDQANKAARASLEASLDGLPPHVLSTVAEDAEKLGWMNVANRDALGAIVTGRTGQLTSDFTSLTKDVQTRLISSLQTGVALGESPAKVAKRIHAAVDDPIRFGQSRSLMISRTQLARAYDQTSRASYAIARDNGAVVAWEWQAFSSACPICGELDGQVFDIEMDTYRHPNCRCSILPVLPDTAKAKQKRFTGSENIELKTSDSGWTSWAPKKKGTKPKKVTRPPKQPKAPATVTPPSVTQVGPRKITSADDPAFDKITGTDDFHRSITQRSIERGDEYWFDEEANFAVRINKGKRVKRAKFDEFLTQAKDAVVTARPHLPHDPDRTFVFEFNGKARGNTNASTMVGGRHINVNAKQVNLLDDKTPEAVYFPEWSISQGTRVPAERPRRTLIHEMGHNADIRIGPVNQARKTLFDKWRYAGLTKEERILVSRREQTTRNRYGEEISWKGKDGPTAYARTDEHEMYAEAFVAWIERDKLDLGPLAREWVDEWAKMFGWEA